MAAQGAHLEPFATKADLKDAIIKLGGWTRWGLRPSPWPCWSRTWRSSWGERQVCHWSRSARPRLAEICEGVILYAPRNGSPRWPPCRNPHEPFFSGLEVRQTAASSGAALMGADAVFNGVQEWGILDGISRNPLKPP